jgi:imidazolonepropionase-like amidohydrolase
MSAVLFRSAQATVRSRRRWLVIAASVLAATLSNATPNVPPPPQTEALLITGATLHTVSGAVIENGSLRFENGRIVSITGPEGAADVRGAKVVSLPGKHVYPGFVSANSVLGLSEVEAVRATADYAETGAINPNARALVALNPDSEIIPVTRANGVLAELAVPQAGPAGLITGTSALVQLDGWTWEDMGLAPAVALHVRLPTMRFNPALFPPPLDAQLDELRKASAKRLRLLEDSFEQAAAYKLAKANGEARRTDARWEAMLPVFGGSRPVFMQADDVAQIRYALAFAQRFGLKLVIVGGADAWRVASLLRERDVPVVVTGVQRLPGRRDEDYDTAFRLPARLAQAGVRFCIARGASGFEAPHDRNLPFEAASAAAHGLDAAEALRAITLYPAQILGVADRLGSLETGKLASVVVTDGDPLDIRTRVERVFIQGREIDLSNRQTQLYDKYRERLRQRPGSAASAASAPAR